MSHTHVPTPITLILLDAEHPVANISKLNTVFAAIGPLKVCVAAGAPIGLPLASRHNTWILTLCVGPKSFCKSVAEPFTLIVPFGLSHVLICATFNDKLESTGEMLTVSLTDGKLISAH